MRDQRPTSEAAIEALAQGRHGDPFALLGPHREASTGWFEQSYRARGR